MNCQRRIINDSLRADLQQAGLILPKYPIIQTSFSFRDGEHEEIMV